MGTRDSTLCMYQFYKIIPFTCNKSDVIPKTSILSLKSKLMKQLKHSIRGQGKAFKRLIEASFEEWGKSRISKALHNLAFPLLFWARALRLDTAFFTTQ